MKLVEIRIVYNADYPPYCCNTGEDIHELIQVMLQRPDVVHISKVVIPDGGDDD